MRRNRSVRERDSKSFYRETTRLPEELDENPPRKVELRIGPIAEQSGDRGGNRIDAVRRSADELVEGEPQRTRELTRPAAQEKRLLLRRLVATFVGVAMFWPSRVCDPDSAGDPPRPDEPALPNARCPSASRRDPFHGRWGCQSEPAVKVSRIAQQVHRSTECFGQRVGGWPGSVRRREQHERGELASIGEHHSEERASCEHILVA
jgi:hypothetical protein